ncbi:MAG TPA: BlaI/MecI/CopY family transcriptional regulator [Phycisphaerae bacterium]|nr:BlaI/MecI/CopY family transcriptional regulator [Phycisphaerae bacterium]
MGRKKTPQPTDSELAVLGVLWEIGPGTVRQVHEALGSVRGVGYTTTLKTMQVMAEKGLLARDESRRSHVYRPAIDAASVRRRLVRELAGQAFGGSTRKLILHALSAGGVSAEEVRQIRKLLAEHGENRQ